MNNGPYEDSSMPKSLGADATPELWEEQRRLTAAMHEHEAAAEQAIAEREQAEFAARVLAVLGAGETPDTAADGIVSLGHGNYAFGCVEVHVTDAEDDVFTAILESGGGISGDRLERTSGRVSVVKILRRLATTARYSGIFAPYIRLPATRSGGGYTVRIRSASRKC